MNTGKIFISITLTLLISLSLKSAEYKLLSPSATIQITIETGKELKYSVRFHDRDIIIASPISMKLDNGTVFGLNPQIKSKKQTSVNDKIIPVIRQKSSCINDVYNQLEIAFSGEYALIFRAYDDGIAFRWVYKKKAPVKVLSEEVSFYFTKDLNCWFPEESSFLSHQEAQYKLLKLSEITPNRFCSTGMLVDLGDNMKAYISESDLESYPGMYLKGMADSIFGFKSLFAGYPLETQQTRDRTVKVTKYADYIAKVSGPREFPWRVIILTDDDTKLLTSSMIYKLASPCRIKDVTWIKPGKVSWDWWNDNNIYGVDFKSGINTDTYKYYIDFAANYGIEYIILDEGWYYLEDVLKIKEQIDVKELIRYGKEKNVGVILWVTWKALDDKMVEALDAFSQWGAAGIKVDFMQRDDQWMVDYYYRVAQEAAKRHLLVDFHGAYKPTGWLRTYPNVISSEGVQGMEHCKWSANSDPEHNVTLPFIRMVAGPMDYTPGAMLNANKKDFRDVFSEPMSLGTRCHQLGMYVVYESPLQMLADNPSNYYREPECMKFLSRVPTVWDETLILAAKVSDYVLTARRNGDVWYLGGMTDWDPRVLKASLDFLGEGEYTIEIWKDGINADRHASDYKYETLQVDKNSEIEINMSPGGGWAAIITKK
jgi:alpha-glucosidase